MSRQLCDTVRAFRGDHGLLYDVCSRAQKQGRGLGPAAGSAGCTQALCGRGGARRLREGRGPWRLRTTLVSVSGPPGVRMRRSPRPGSVASPHKHTPNFYSDNSNSLVSATSGDSSGHRSAGPGPGEPEGRRAQGSSCGEPALSSGVPGGTARAGSSRQKPAPRSHNGRPACGAATVRGGASGAGGVEPG